MVSPKVKWTQTKARQPFFRLSDIGFDASLRRLIGIPSWALDFSMNSAESICSNVEGHSSFVFTACEVLSLTTCFCHEAQKHAPAPRDLAMPQQPGASPLSVAVVSRNSDLAMLVKQKRSERRQANKDAVRSDQTLQLALQSAHPHSLSPAVEPLLAHHMVQYSDWSLDTGSDVQSPGIAIRPSIHEDSVPISQCVPGCRAAAALDLSAVSMTASWKDFWLAMGNGVSTAFNNKYFHLSHLRLFGPTSSTWFFD